MTYEESLLEVPFICLCLSKQSKSEMTYLNSTRSMALLPGSDA